MPPDVRRYEIWAAAVLLILAALGAIFAFLIVMASLSQGLPITLTSAIVSALGLPVLALTGRGLLASQSWARGASVWLLLIILVQSVLDLVLALLNGALQVPLAAVAAGVLLVIAPEAVRRPDLGPQERRLVTVLLAVFVFSVVVPRLLVLAAR